MLDYLEYTITWAIYLAGALGLIMVWWRITRPIPWYTIRQAFRVLFAAPILVPVPVLAGATDWAPALFVLMLDSLLAQDADTARVFPYLIYALVLGLVALVIDGLFRYWWVTKSSTNMPVSQ